MINVVCLKHGTKYSSLYVNRLKNMIKRHLTVPFRFVCFTDNPEGIDNDVVIEPLPSHDRISGWWWKPYLFKPGLFPLGETVLFFDLDMVIISNIDNLIHYEPGSFVGLRDVGRVFQPDLNKLGSAVMRWTSGEHSDIWYGLDNDPKITRRFRGDQDWIWHQKKDIIKFFPDKWIVSYKWEVRDRSELVRTDNRWTFKTTKCPKLDSDTAVLAFHGTPNPEDVNDPIIVDNWR
jgi:hypothetical protein